MASLYQTDFWTDKDGVTHSISGMDTSYLENVINFLERHALHIELSELNKLVALAPADPSDGVADFFDGAIAELMQDPHVWVKTLPVYKALVAERDSRLKYKIKKKLRRLAYAERK